MIAQDWILVIREVFWCIVGLFALAWVAGVFDKQ